MISDEQLIEALREGFAAQVTDVRPRPDLLRVLGGELGHLGARSRRRRRWVRREPVFGVLTVAVVVAVVLVALLDLHSSGTTRGSSGLPAAASPALTVGSSRLIKTTRDPSDGGSWGLRETRVAQHRACLEIGRVRDGGLGVLGEDGAYQNDGALHPFTTDAAERCDKTDADGRLFLDVMTAGLPTSAAQGQITGCTVTEPNVQPGAGVCPSKDVRSAFFGVLGPDATRITYRINGRSGTQRTGPEGSYLIVVPDNGRTCTEQAPGGTHCVLGSGDSTAHGLRPGAITSVTYQNGTSCRPINSNTTLVQKTCPNVGYAHYPPRTIPTITAQQAKATLHVSHVVTDHVCYKTGVRGVAPEIACDHGIPAGYKRQTGGADLPTLLISLRFTAPLHATNHHSVYEYSVGRVSGPSCKIGGGGADGTTMKPIAKGSHVLIQDQEGVCPGIWKGIVSYQPNGHPGGDTLMWDAPIHDRSTVVGRFSFTVR